MNELNELRNQACENSLIYKEKTKRIHDSKIKNRIFNVGDRVLFNSRLKIFSGKLKTRWTGPFTVTQVLPYGTVELSQTDWPNFKVSHLQTAEEKDKEKNDSKQDLEVNAATKKTQKTLLKQQYENFSATSAESLDSIFNRLQKIVSRLAILGGNHWPKKLNFKFLSSLPSEWNTHVVVWMNKLEIEIMSIDDLYNNFKIVEQKIKKIVGTSSGGQNLAFMTAPKALAVSNDANYCLFIEELEQIHEDDLEAMDLKWQLSLLSETNIQEKPKNKAITDQTKHGMEKTKSIRSQKYQDKGLKLEIGGSINLAAKAPTYAKPFLPQAQTKPKNHGRVPFTFFYHCIQHFTPPDKTFPPPPLSPPSFIIAMLAIPYHFPSFSMAVTDSKE
ncbi:hypothetical protein Tco_1035206 [Tanacetum coccineum]